MARFDIALFRTWGSEENIDRLFFFWFYICVGLVPPLIAVVGHKVLHIPLFIISILIFLRFFMRKDCRHAMILKARSPAVILLGCFGVVVALHAMINGVDGSSQLRILTKSLFILQICMFLLFVWSQNSRLNVNLLFKLSLAGVLGGLFIIVLKIGYGHYLGVGFTRAPNLLTSLLHIHDTINDALKILVIFTFFAVCGLETSRQRYATLLALLATIFIVSLYTVGFEQHGSQAVIVRFQSETVQFGIPLALLVLAFAQRAPVWTTNFLIFLFAFIFINAPWLFQLWIRVAEILPLPKHGQILYRAEIWEGVARKISDAPLFGFGVDSVRYLQNIDLANRYKSLDTFTHPHNMVLQLWLDLGLFGVLIVLALGYFVWRSVSQIEMQWRPPVLAGLTMLAVFALVTHSFWQTWSLALLAFVAALVSLLVPRLEKS